MLATIFATHGGHEMEATTHPPAVAFYQSGTPPFETANRAAARFNPDLRRHRSSRNCQPTTADLERHGWRAEPCHFCSAASDDEAGVSIRTTAREGRQ